MGLLHRVADILKGNINRILDRVEDPELVLDQIIQEMQEAYRKSKIDVAKALADEKRLKNLMKTNHDTASKWARKAVLAVERNDDDLAREALRRRRSYEDIAREFEAQWSEQKSITDVLREKLFALESKIDEARRKKSLLVARQKRALAHQKLKDTLAQATSEQETWALGRFEEKVAEIEIRADAELDLLDRSFDQRLMDLEYSDNIEDELTALKMEIGSRPELEPAERGIRTLAAASLSKRTIELAEQYEAKQPEKSEPSSETPEAAPATDAAADAREAAPAAEPATLPPDPVIDTTPPVPSRPVERAAQDDASKAESPTPEQVREAAAGTIAPGADESPARTETEAERQTSEPPPHERPVQLPEDSLSW